MSSFSETVFVQTLRFKGLMIIMAEVLVIKMMVVVVVIMMMVMVMMTGRRMVG